jgi:hypothetical protein
MLLDLLVTWQVLSQLTVVSQSPLVELVALPSANS